MGFYNLPKNRLFLISQKALIRDNSKLFIIKNNTDKYGYKTQWELPGGLLEIDESIEHGLKREVKEESGFDIEILNLATYWDHFEKDFKLKDERIFDVRVMEVAYQCKIIGGAIKLSDEHKEYIWATENALKSLDFSKNSEAAVKWYLNHSQIKQL